MITNETTTPPKTKMTNKLTTIGHLMAFNNKQHLFRIVSGTNLFKFAPDDDKLLNYEL